jgi:hypothetical protein
MILRFLFSKETALGKAQAAYIQQLTVQNFNLSRDIAMNNKEIRSKMRFTDLGYRDFFGVAVKKLRASTGHFLK